MTLVDFTKVRASLAHKSLVGFGFDNGIDIYKAGTTKCGLPKSTDAKRGLKKVNGSKRGIKNTLA